MRIQHWILALLLGFSSTPVHAQEPDENNRQPLKVFLLVGQSNMQGHARIHTLEHVGMDQKTKPIFEMLGEADASPKIIENVWINSLRLAP